MRMLITDDVQFNSIGALSIFAFFPSFALSNRRIDEERVRKEEQIFFSISSSFWVYLIGDGSLPSHTTPKTLAKSVFPTDG